MPGGVSDPMKRRLRIGVFFGGESGEHDVSLMSGLAIMEALKERHDVLPIGITRSGQFLPGADAKKALQAHGVEPGPDERALRPAETGGVIGALDVVIPALHGPRGEDGTVQGLLELAGIPYVGSGVLGSAVSMDKAIMKNVFEAAGLPVAPWFLLTEAQWEKEPGPFREKAREMGLPLFVKPANMGSSVGIVKVKSMEELDSAVEEALRHDRRVVVEKGLTVRELECGVLGNDTPQASVVGEIRPKWEFYDYQAKYEEGGAELIIPAPIATTTSDELREIAVRAFMAVDGAGLARVDCFLEEGTDKVYLNEINTFPGFTPFSMYPKLWEATGVSYPELLDRLVELALERHDVQRRKRGS